MAAKRRALERRLDAILAAPSGCELARALQAKLRRARDQLLTFVDWPGRVAATNNACERHLRPAAIQRKVTNGHRATWAAEGGAAEGSARGSAWKGSGGEADIRTVVDTAQLKPGTSVFGTILRTVSARSPCPRRGWVITLSIWTAEMLEKKADATSTSH